MHRETTMKPLLRIFAILALLSGVAFAPGGAGAGYAALLLLMTAASVFIALLVLSAAAFAFWRNEKEGSLKKRLAEFAFPVGVFNGALLISLIIAVAMLVPPLQPILGNMYVGGTWVPESSSYVGAIWVPYIVALVLIVAPFLVTSYVCRKYAKTSWSYLAAVFLLVALELSALAYIAWGAP